MTNNTKLLTILASISSALPILLFADVTGADPRLTGAPGDGQSACTACHTGTALNGGGGSVKIIMPGGTNYTPGTKQHIQVQVSDSAQRRWGFELTARVASNPSNGQAGDLASTDSNTKVICDNGRQKPCSTSSPVQFITHTQTGTRLGTSGSAIFEFDWTPPSTDVGTITLYAAGNAANGNNLNTGDHIYTTSLSLTPAAVTSTKPAVKGDSGVVNAASFQTSIAPNSWVTILGSNLASTTRTWTSDELAGGNLPTSLDGVSVTINGKPAYVEYISPTQINVVAPADDTVGPVEVRVTSGGQSSDPVIGNVQSFAPAFFSFDGKYLAATHSDNSLLGKSGLFASAPNGTTPAKPGETIVLYGTGFGPTNPAVAAGKPTTQIANVTTPFTVTIGAVPASVSFAGLIPPFADLFQFNVQVPSGVADGDQAVVVQIGGVSSLSGDACCFITVQK
jgi:uncharacterized protein (TIGR03437 family)